MSNKTCRKCKKEKEICEFTDSKKIKEFTTCFTCRETARKWREKNKERVSKYNKLTLTKNKIGKKEKLIYARKKSTDDWMKFNTQVEAAESLKLYKSNINKVLNGKLKTTGGYEFKFVEEDNNVKLEKTWKEIKEENNYSSGVEKSPNRIQHEVIDNIKGKKCCTCKEWKALTNYNKSKTHWDNLRNDCKDCLKNYRKNNRKKITQTIVKYEKKRKQNDPEFKLLKTLRSRLGCALNKVKCKKSLNTMQLTGCTVKELKTHIENLFVDDMTWENHGKYWHVDHIIPCDAFDLTKQMEQLVCFNYINLQPLHATKNLEKGRKYDPSEKKKLYEQVMVNNINEI